jgi:hypothetical protein
MENTHKDIINWRGLELRRHGFYADASVFLIETEFIKIKIVDYWQIPVGSEEFKVKSVLSYYYDEQITIFAPTIKEALEKLDKEVDNIINYFKRFIEVFNKEDKND